MGSSRLNSTEIDVKGIYKPSRPTKFRDNKLNCFRVKKHKEAGKGFFAANQEIHATNSFHGHLH